LRESFFNRRFDWYQFAEIAASGNVEIYGVLQICQRFVVSIALPWHPGKAGHEAM
jgi:hypothetical protein